MNLSIIPTLLLAISLQGNPVQIEELLGKWQLVYFEAIARLKNSPRFQNSSPAMKADLDYKIKNRLENTVYQFVEGDSLFYNDYQNRDVVQKRAKIEISPDNVLTIFDGKSSRKAKIVSLEEDKLVLEPISDGEGAGKLTFERIIPEKKK
ncbi:hypothetical protein PBT90_02900 [Algoriphagus halophytocola]|uniref:Lipocalin-like domain-containing protein n=1 Tax=Algoriphagus halophytocola TaxID=2991499 RepID=A0ABY6MGR1_9BACT|nr:MULTISPECIES: hypothetical protein [unclassified Algoriphagus]UZD22378.1 hypothetical protein OM944_17180 [Algoriphagus sp. TR-M5]WBL43637.1 hypothetical protein PBT90_02900 [Algoriphagus sp. TR-M9]